MPHIEYHERAVASHGDACGPAVLLVNEAPGPSEAASGVPSFGQQGANLFHALRSAGIAWATASQKFVWPKDGKLDQSDRHRLKAAFLDVRARHLTCTNSFPRWPRPSGKLMGFCAPLDADVCAPDNLKRLRSEIAPTHRAILVCGRSAYLACVGTVLQAPASRDLSALTAPELEILNDRLGARFEQGWYMGHTRRWSTHGPRTASNLRSVARFVGWKLVSDAAECGR